MSANHSEKIIVWFRNDLRVYDHEALHKASQKQGVQVIPFYCFDERHYEQTALGFPKTDAFRAEFILEAVQDLRKNLQDLGSDLIIRIGKPEEEILNIAQQQGIKAVYTHQEVTYEEIKTEQIIEEQLWKHRIALETFWGSTLFHLEDLPYPIQSLPDIFTQFRKSVEKRVKVRATFPKPTALAALPEDLEKGEIPCLHTLGLENKDTDTRSVLDFKGGEAAAWQRVRSYIWEQDLLKVYKDTRNGLLGADYSSKFSAWLALGCISARGIYEQVKRYEKERISNESTYWLVFELLWRDYFRFVAKKFGNHLFFKEGIKGTLAFPLYDNEALFEKWKNGETGIPFIDANMIELKETGFMSNRGRQNVASFLVKDLQINWTWGAMYFESTLIDYDVCSNWGNWNYVAGVGNDPRENRYFNIISQAKRYDSKGEYTKQWLPELEELPAHLVHHPTLSKKEQDAYGVKLGGNYPIPIVPFRKWLN